MYNNSASKRTMSTYRHSGSTNSTFASLKQVSSCLQKKKQTNKLRTIKTETELVIKQSELKCDFVNFQVTNLQLYI